MLASIPLVEETEVSVTDRRLRRLEIKPGGGRPLAQPR